MFVEFKVDIEDKEVLMIIRKDEIIRVLEVDGEVCDVIYKPSDMEESLSLIVKEPMQMVKAKLIPMTIWGNMNSGNHSIMPLNTPITALQHNIPC